MATKAKWYDYPMTLFDKNTAINDDGYIVHANGLFDNGDTGTALTDEQVNYYRHGDRNGYDGDTLRSMTPDSVGGNTFDEVFDSINASLSNNSFWNSLSDAQKKSFLKSYGSNLSYQTVLDDITALESIGGAPNIQMPISSELYADIDAELNPAYNTARSRLDEESALMRQDYQDQLQSSADMYNRQASGLLSNQYLSNAQTYDALQSDMRKARQNALEAGASAGIRLAGNVNALLTAQNKQSQTAMDTSNALAEMLLQQRNAAAGIRSDYRNYMSDVNQRRTDLDTQQRTERENLYNQRYNNAVNDYDTQWGRWENRINTLPESNKFKSAYQTYERNKVV